MGCGSLSNLSQAVLRRHSLDLLHEYIFSVLDFRFQTSDFRFDAERSGANPYAKRYPLGLGQIYNMHSQPIIWICVILNPILKTSI